MQTSSLLRRIRIATWIIVAIGLTAGGLYFLTQRGPEIQKAIGGAARIGGPFQLVSHTGQPFTERDLAGKPYAIFFGFTHCPDICPTTLLDMSNRLEELKVDGDKLRMVFVSVDPERDTPQYLAEYLKSFDKRIIGLTGTQAQMAAIAKAYRVIYEKVPGTGGDYTMNHTATVYLFDANGQFASTLAYQESEQNQRAKLKRLIGG
ncbi:MAG: SCO family protein [Hyphomicrobiaceae bacterium]